MTGKKFALGAFNQLANARTAHGGVLPKEMWLDTLAASFDEATKAAKVKAPKPRDELFDALAMACGVNPAEITRAIGSSIGIALADIKSVSPGLTPDDLRRRADLFKRKHRDWSLTPFSLAKYWGELGPANGQTFAARQELPPTGWEDAFKAVQEAAGNGDGAYQISRGWDSLAKNQKDAVRRHLAGTVPPAQAEEIVRGLRP